MVSSADYLLLLLFFISLKAYTHTLDTGLHGGMRWVFYSTVNILHRLITRRNGNGDGIAPWQNKHVGKTLKLANKCFY